MIKKLKLTQLFYRVLRFTASKTAFAARCGVLGVKFTVLYLVISLKIIIQDIVFQSLT